MTNDELINQALKELKSADRAYKMFSEFSFMEGLDKNDPQFIKIRYMLVRLGPFEKHTENAIKLSALGLTIVNDYEDWFHYKKSLRPKRDIIKIGTFVIALLTFIWIVVFQGIRNDRLSKANNSLIKRQDSLIIKTNQLTDSISKLRIRLSQ